MRSDDASKSARRDSGSWKVASSFTLIGSGIAVIRSGIALRVVCPGGPISAAKPDANEPGASEREEVAMRTSLHDGWTVCAVGGDVPAGLVGREIPAMVPGCVTTDLLAAGLVPDPYLDENEGLLAWIGRTDWRFRTHFVAESPVKGERVDLVCEGLDTVATLTLNDDVIGSSANMHRSYRFDLTCELRGGENELSITFAAPINSAEAMSEQLGARPHALEHPFNAIRKMACNFGWDWGPDLPTSGIWRPIALERWRVARLATVRPIVEVSTRRGDRTALASRRGGNGSPAPSREEPARQGGGHVGIHVELEVADTSRALMLRAHLGAASSVVPIGPGETNAVLELDAEEVELWWPAGYGSPVLYELDVELVDATEESEVGAGEPVPMSAHALRGSEVLLSSWRRRIGFRTVELDTSIDEIGRRFTILVNGVPISVRGANWIPDDCFVHRVDRPRYGRRLGDALEANMNLLRVWGGGIYESDDFYDLADELGLLVWQDFCFACAAYAEEEPLRSEVVAEATEVVTRLAPHPSLVLWNGCNENIWGHEDWGWKSVLDGRSWGGGYYFELLPEIVARLDPTRPYVPGSPWSGTTDLHPNDPNNGTIHIWDVWNERDYLAYREYAPRFVAEFGFQGPPTWATLTRAVRDVPLSLDGPAMRSHQKAADGAAKLERGLVAHLRAPETFEDWHWASSLNQARAVALGVEYWRSIEPACAGIVVWQLNDCWPVVSWAAVDGDGRRKPLWYALRRSYRDRLLTIQPNGKGLDLVAVNDSLTSWPTSIVLSRRHFDGGELARARVEIDVGAGGRARLALPARIAEAGDEASELVVAEVADHAASTTNGTDEHGRALWFFAEDKDLDLPPPELETSLEHSTDGYRLTIRARTLQRDVSLLADKVAGDAVVDEMLVTLLPKESVTLRVSSHCQLDASELVSPRVLRSANQLVHRAR